MCVCVCVSVIIQSKYRLTWHQDGAKRDARGRLRKGAKQCIQFRNIDNATKWMCRRLQRVLASAAKQTTTIS